MRGGIEIDGVTKSLREWAKDAPVSYSTAYRRIQQGWDPKKALYTPVTPMSKRVTGFHRHGLRFDRQEGMGLLAFIVVLCMVVILGGLVAWSFGEDEVWDGQNVYLNYHCVKSLTSQGVDPEEAHKRCENMFPVEE